MSNIDSIQKNWPAEVRVSNPYNYALEILVDHEGVVIRGFNSAFHAGLVAATKDLKVEVIKADEIRS